MRSTRTVILLATLLLFEVAKANAQTARLSVSGKVIFQHGNSPCERCEVSLENYGRLVDTVFSDTVGKFIFMDLEAGQYVLKVKSEGFEPVEESIEVSQFSPANTLIVLGQKVAPSPNNSDSDNVIHISSYLKRYPEKAVDLYKKAYKNVRKNKRGEAISQLENAIEIAPDFYAAHNYLGVLYKAAGRLEDAEKEFEIAENLNASSPDPLINLSGLYIDKNQPERAVQASEKAIKRDSRSAPAFFNLGIALYRASRFVLAQDALQKALSIAPKMGQARLALANVFMKLQNFVGLREQLKAFLKENPKARERETIQQFLNELPEQQESRQ